MGKLILKIIGALVFFTLLLAAFGGGVGSVELAIWAVLLIATLVALIRQHQARVRRN